MSISLLNIAVRHNKDVLLARLRARQVVRLLGLRESEQVRIAALVFEIARQGIQEQESIELTFRIEEGALEVLVTEDQERAGPVRLQEPIVGRDPKLTPEDMVWLLEHMVESTPRSLFDEVQQQNQDLLGT